MAERRSKITGIPLQEAVFVLVGECGEGDDFDRRVLGVFTSEKAAAAAVSNYKDLCDIRAEEYNEWRKRHAAYLARFTRLKTEYPLSYTWEQYAEAEAFCGRPPEPMTKFDNYRVEEFFINEIGDT